ncbi:diguanylate cyclase [Pseudomonas putida]|nr:diguanylate cyclase [Pseudomonas putida]NVN70571.1 diguanylate cyclase [Pseudomonas putida]
MGAGLPANTGEARAIHRGVFFVGKPAPTRIVVICAMFSWLR